MVKAPNETMNKISLKGISAGILVSLILGIPVNIIFSVYFVETYNEITSNIDLSDENVVHKIDRVLMYHPLSIAFLIAKILITVGIPAYIAALVADKAYILNAVILGSVVLLFLAFDFETVIQDPFLFAVLAIFLLVVACLSGLLRYKQVTKSTV